MVGYYTKKLLLWGCSRSLRRSNKRCRIRKNNRGSHLYIHACIRYPVRQSSSELNKWSGKGKLEDDSAVYSRHRQAWENLFVDPPIPGEIHGRVGTYVMLCIHVYTLHVLKVFEILWVYSIHVCMCGVMRLKPPAVDVTGCQRQIESSLRGLGVFIMKLLFVGDMCILAYV